MLLVIDMEVTRGHKSYSHDPPNKRKCCVIMYIQINSNTLPYFLISIEEILLKYLHQKGRSTVD